MDGLNAAAKAKDAKIRDAMSALAEDYRQIVHAVVWRLPALVPPVGSHRLVSTGAILPCRRTGAVSTLR